MALKVWLFLLAMTLLDVSPKAISEDNTENVTAIAANVADVAFPVEVKTMAAGSLPADNRVVSIQGSANDLCLAKLEMALSSISMNRVNSMTNMPMIDLTGYALHQPLKSVPVDMYVTDMRVKVPTNLHWAKIDKCHFDPNTKILQAKLVFKDLIVTASVKLLNEEYLKLGNPTEAVTDKCNMTLRLRQAGLGFVAIPQHVKAGAVGIRTSATFVDPNFISIHAYNCQPMDVPDQQRSVAAANAYTLDGPEGRSPTTEDVSQEMEDIFLRGIRSLLTKYMEKQLQPALKDTLMMNLGYTISYGRRRRR